MDEKKKKKRLHCAIKQYLRSGDVNCQKRSLHKLMYICCCTFNIYFNYFVYLHLFNKTPKVLFFILFHCIVVCFSFYFSYFFLSCSGPEFIKPLRITLKNTAKN